MKKNKVKKLFFSGGGSEIESKALDSAFKEKIMETRKENLTVAYIPIALSSSPKYAGAKKWFESLMADIDVDIEIWNDLSNPESFNWGGIGALYVGGGDTRILATEMLNQKFIDILHENVSKGLIYYGGSAGAIVAGKDIGMIKKTEIDYIEPGNQTGLDIIEGYSVWPHFSEKDTEAIHVQSNRYFSSILAIPTGSGISVEGDNVKVFGELGISIFKPNIENRRYNSANTFTL